MKSILSVTVLAVLTAGGLMAFPEQATSVPVLSAPVGNVGNAADPTNGFGAVGYRYEIGRYEVTNAQYAAFLNAVAATDANNLYNTSMAGSAGGITRSGAPGSYVYATVSGRANHPVNFVSFWDATRFANWLHNGQPTGAQDNTTTENGAYTLTPAGIAANSITRNPVWRWAVTSQNEWYKAAYHQPSSQGGDGDGYWLFPTSSNAAPTTAQANFNNVIGGPTAVGSYASNYSCAAEMGGNVAEWNESVASPLTRQVRGGGFTDVSAFLSAGNSGSFAPTSEFSNIGFRVARNAELPPQCQSDINGDGFINTADLVLFLSDFGLTCHP